MYSFVLMCSVTHIRESDVRTRSKGLESSTVQTDDQIFFFLVGVGGLNCHHIHLYVHLLISPQLGATCPFFYKEVFCLNFSCSVGATLILSDIYLREIIIFHSYKTCATLILYCLFYIKFHMYFFNCLLILKLGSMVLF